MRSAPLFVALILSAPAQAQFDVQSPPPNWMVRGFEAAIADPASFVFTIESRDLVGLTKLVPSERAGSVIAKLLPLLGAPDWRMQSAAARALGQIATGDRAGPVIDKLLPLLGATDWQVRAEAARALGQLAIGERAGPVIDKLLPLLFDTVNDVQGTAAQALGRLATGDRTGRVIDKLLPLLGSAEVSVQSAAAQALGQLATGERAGPVIDKLLPLLGSAEPSVRSAAAQALGQLAPGEHAGAVIDKLLPLLGDPNNYVNRTAAQALGQLATSERAGALMDKLLPLLGSQDWIAASAASEALGQLVTGDRAGPLIDKLLPLLDNPDVFVRDTATQALAPFAAFVPSGRSDAVIDKLLSRLAAQDRLGVEDLLVRGAAAQAIGQLSKLVPSERADAVIDKLLPLLGSQSWQTRDAAAQALGQLAIGDRAGPVINKLFPLLGDPVNEVRVATVQALGQLAIGKRAGPVIEKLLPLLGDPDSDVRFGTAQALGQLATGDRASPVINKLLPLLGDPFSAVRVATVQALGQLAIGEHAGPVIDKLLALLREPNSAVSSVAAQALGQLATGDRAGPVIDKLLALLADPDNNVGSAAIEVIGKIGPAGLSTSVTVVRLINAGRDEDAGWLRAAAHVASGAEAKSELLLAWLGRPASQPLESVADNPAQAHIILQLLTNNWAILSKGQRAREEAENAIMAAIEAACRTPVETSSLADFAHAAVAWLLDLPFEGPVHHCWTPEQKRTVEALLASFKEAHSTHSRALAEHLKGEDLAPVGLWLTWSLGLWTLFWIAFLFAFPWSPTIQAIFFWNPRARQFFSAGFVPLLLLVVPLLRRRLLAPFRDDLVAQARLDDLPKLGYFANGRASVNGGEPIPVSQLLSGLHRVAVLQADSGLGKTSLLREIAAKTTRPIAFLHAIDCAEGVDVAISRIIHDVQETGFARSLVYTRALTVIVDGLNEVSADTREKISAFARDMSKGHVIVATQPIEWRPPPNSCKVVLVPLDRSEATAFIESRPVGADTNQRCNGQAYKAAVQKFVSRALDEAPSDLERRTAELMLSNPFDLAFAAELLARGLVPSPTALIDEAFRLANESYREIAKFPFPLGAFGLHAVKMRVEDRNWLKRDEFTAEASCLLEQRLLISRAMKGVQGIEERLLFRHDRVWDFFTAAAFADDNDLLVEHLGEARFRGAYVRIAETWDLERAKRVRDQLNVSAAFSGDHSTSDEFIKRLEIRLGAR